MKNKSWLEEKRRTDFRVKRMIENGINHWCGTITPAPKHNERKEIESLKSAIEFYLSSYNGDYIKEIVLQTKYMGSYCAVYVYKDIYQSKFFSRNGYLINHLDREKLISALKPIHEKLFDEETPSNIEYIIIESELLPWRAMGNGLIEKEFVNYYNLNKDLVGYKEEYSLIDKISSITESNTYKEYKSGSDVKSHIKRQYESLDILNNILKSNLNEEKSLNIFKTQLDNFAYESDVFELKGFNILKAVTFEINSKREQYFYRDNYNNFKRINEDETLLLNFSDKNKFDENIEKAYAFLDKNKEGALEGIMVKPRYNRLINIPHAMKVRNNDYLQLIYGIRFDVDYDYYFEKRNVSSKKKAAIEDSELAIALNSINPTDLLNTNKNYENILYKLLNCEKFTKTLDTRL